MPAIVWGVPGGALMALALGVAFVYGIWLSFRETQHLVPRRRLWLRTLRVFSASLAFLVVASPGVVREATEEILGRRALLFDTSRSMSLPLSSGDATRRDVARATAEAWMETLREGESASPWVRAFDAEGRDAELGDLARGYPTTGDETKLVAALEALVQSEGGDELGAIVVVSDGAETARDPSEGRAESTGVDEVAERMAQVARSARWRAHPHARCRWRGRSRR